ncbi:hypothetical protein PDN30_15975 [Bacillus cereus]|nr:hypothetical protein [Bacillus cereus]
MSKKVEVILSEIDAIKFDSDDKLQIYGSLGYKYNSDGSLQAASLWSQDKDSCIILEKDYPSSRFQLRTGKFDLEEGGVLTVGGHLMEHNQIESDTDMGYRGQDINYDEITTTSFIERNIIFNENNNVQASVKFLIMGLDS